VKINLRIAALAAALSLYGAATAGAQQEEHKPGGLNKVAHDISKTSKKAGRDTKAEIKRDASKTHNALTDAGNDTKAGLKKATGIKAPQSHQPGGLNKVARDISHASKKAGSEAKGDLKTGEGWGACHHHRGRQEREGHGAERKTLRHSAAVFGGGPTSDATVVRMRVGCEARTPQRPTRIVPCMVM
jgi:hypothetical protein